MQQYQSLKLSVKELIKSCDILILSKSFLISLFDFVLNAGDSSKSQLSGTNRLNFSFLVSKSLFQRSSSGLSWLYTVYDIVFDEKVSSLP